MASTPARYRALLFSLLALHVALLWIGVRRNFVTVDEACHIPSGLAHWQTGWFVPYRVNPPLPRMVATLPVLPAAPTIAVGSTGDSPGYRPEWSLGPEFATTAGPRYFELVCLARLAGMGWSLAGAWLVWVWARELYGNASGCLGVGLWCFGPNILAHAEIVTADLPAAVAGLAATYFFWRYLRQPSWGKALGAGLLLGLAQLTKYTLLVLYGAWPLLALLYWAGRRSPGGESRWRACASQATAIALLSVLVINFGYAFRGSGRSLGEYSFVSRLFRESVAPDSSEGGVRHVGNRFADSWLGRVPVPLPADYLLGIDIQRADFESSWACYLDGRWEQGGRWYFYLYALALKVPVGTLALVAGGFVLALVRHPAAGKWRDEALLWIPALFLLVLVSSQTGINYFRYLLPAFPFAIVGAAKMGYFLQPGRWHVGVPVLGLLGWTVGSSLAVQPHPLAYFNELAGGPSNGHAHLVDGDLDWGQDLLDLKEWLDEHPEARPLGLVYFNVIDPRVIGLDYYLPPLREHSSCIGDCAPALAPGFYAVSATLLRGKSFPAPTGQGAFENLPVNACDVFAGRLPVARAGYSIFIFHVQPEERQNQP
jgi:hypothetical protein